VILKPGQRIRTRRWTEKAGEHPAAITAAPVEGLVIGLYRDADGPISGWYVVRLLRAHAHEFVTVAADWCEVCAVTKLRQRGE